MSASDRSADRSSSTVRLRRGLALVMVGVLVQIAAALHFRPGTFILSAAIGVPLVFAGALLTWLAARGAGRDGKEQP
jgi:hypothetical protein